MNKILKSIHVIILTLSLFTHNSSARDLWLKDIPLKQLKKLYNEIDYKGRKGYLMIPSYKYPSIFLKNFPTNYSKIMDETERNALFIKILAPLTLKINQEIINERKVILNINSEFQKGNQLSDKNINTLEITAKKYDIFTRLKSHERYSYILSELITRIDVIPPSILITAAALETNWGSSRIVKEGNSLYKTLIWHTEKGLKPRGETSDNSYRIKTYPDIYSSMIEFTLKINSHPAFKAMRNMRKELRDRHGNMYGTLLAPYIFGNSQLQNYAGIFDYTMTYYELLIIDKSSLADNMITKEIEKKYSQYTTNK